MLFFLYLSAIPVGAGSAGSILAAHLAEDKHSVLLLEAGGTAPFFFDIPLLGPLIQNTVYDWQYITVSQEHACKGLINNVNILIYLSKNSNYQDLFYSKADGLEVKFSGAQAV